MSSRESLQYFSVAKYTAFNVSLNGYSKAKKGAVQLNKTSLRLCKFSETFFPMDLKYLSEYPYHSQYGVA